MQKHSKRKIILAALLFAITIKALLWSSVFVTLVAKKISSIDYAVIRASYGVR